MAGNSDLRNANKAKKDEFYTMLNVIEDEMKHYKAFFKGKKVFCNCDDPYESNFFKYFAMNFNVLGLKKLVATSYVSSPFAWEDLPMFDSDFAYMVEINEVVDYNDDGAIDLVDVEYLLKNNKNIRRKLNEGGDFRSQECIELLKKADVVVTNPPFSLFREYVNQLVEYNKKFIIIGNVNAISYKDIFKLIKEDRLWLGYSIHSGDREFRIPDDYPVTAAGYRIDENGTKFIRVKGVRWYTNIDYEERHEDLLLYRQYNEEDYPKYDYYDAINVDSTVEIPCDYDGLMGVPITFLDKYNPDQFEIMDGIGRYSMLSGPTDETKGKYLTKINDVPKYARIIIKKRYSNAN